MSSKLVDYLQYELVTTSNRDWRIILFNDVSVVLHFRLANKECNGESKLKWQANLPDGRTRCLTEDIVSLWNIVGISLHSPTSSCSPTQASSACIKSNIRLGSHNIGQQKSTLVRSVRRWPEFSLHTREKHWKTLCGRCIQRRPRRCLRASLVTD